MKCFLAIRILCLGIVIQFLGVLDVRAQLTDATVIQREEELFLALKRVEVSHPDEIEGLCREYRKLITSRLWTWLSNSAAMSSSNEDLNGSIQAYRIALKVAEVLKDPRLMATSYYALGRQLAAMGRFADAIEAYSSSCNYFADAGLPRDQLYVLSHLSQAYYFNENFKSAREYAEKCIAVAASLGGSETPPGPWPDEYAVAEASSILAYLCLRDARFIDAIEQFNRALSLYELLDDGLPVYGRQITNTLDALGDTYGLTGDYRIPILYFNQALKIARKRALRPEEAGLLLRLGTLYLKRDDYERANYFLAQSLQLATELDNRHTIASASLALGMTALKEGQYEKSLTYLRNSLELARSLNDTDSIIVVRENVGALFFARGDLESALAEMKVSEELARTVNDPVRIAETTWWEAAILNRMRNYKDAVRLASESSALARQLGLPKLAHVAAVTLASSQLAQNHDDLAEETLAHALNELEEMRGNIAGNVQQQQFFFGKRIGAYHLLIDLLVKQHRMTEALNYAERAKARVLYDLLRDGHPQPNSLLTEEERSEEQRVNRDIATLNRQVREEKAKPQPDDLHLQDLHAKLKASRNQYAAFHDLLVASHPELKARPYVPAPLGRKDLDRLIPDSHAALLEFVVTESQVFLFTLTASKPGGEPDLRVYTAAVTRDELARQVGRLHWLMSNRHPSFQVEARTLYDLLLKPAEAQLKGVTTLCIVPDDVLWDVPFQALQSRTDRYVVEDLAIYYAPSLSVLNEISARPPRGAKSLIALGNPTAGTEAIAQLKETHTGLQFDPLPEAEVEVRTISRNFGAQRSAVLIGAKASESVFKEESPNYGVIHFATHGVFDNLDPLYSYLILGDGGGEDGLLETREVMDLDLRADLVVLSACETARGRIGAGEGVIGMSWAFFAAGCRATVVSQWKVKSASTSQLMIGFYGNLNSGMARVESLRRAQLELLKGTRFNHPFYWASFVIVGSSR